MASSAVLNLLVTPQFTNDASYLRLWNRLAGRQGDTLRKKIQEAVGAATTKGFSIQAADRYGQRLLQQASRISDLQEAQIHRDAELERKLQSELLSDREKQTLRIEYLRHQQEIDNLERKFKREMEEAEKIGDAIAENAAKSFSERSEEIGEGISGAFQDAMKADLKSWGDLLKSAGQQAQVSGAQMGDAGGIGKMLGPLLGKIGKFLTLVGPLLSGFGSILTMFFELDAALKEFNKELFDGGAAAGELIDQFGDMEQSLDNVRDAFTSFEGINISRLYGTTAKENAKIIGQFAAAGHTYQELTHGIQDATKAQEKLRDATETTLIYSRLFGEEAGQMSERVSDYMESLGYSLESVAQSLSQVHMQAMQSGFGIKRFFTLLNQATADMSMYNVRLEEAGQLLANLGKVMGAEEAGQQVAGLTKGFAEESVEARRKRILTTPGMAELMKRSAETASDMFVKNLETARGGSILKDVLTGAGLEVTPGGLVSGLGAMSKEEQAKLLVEAGKSGNDDLVRSLEVLMRASAGATGSMEGMIAGMGALGPGAKLVAMMTQGMDIFGAGKALYQFTSVQRQAFETFTGISGQQYEQLSALSKMMEGRFLKLQEVLKSGETMTEAQEKELIKLTGATIENGKIVQAAIKDDQIVRGKREVKSSNDLLMMDESMSNILAQGVDQDKLLAQQMASRVTEISKILEVGIEALLLRIAGAVDNIWSHISFSGLDEDEKANLRVILEKLEARTNELRNQEAETTKEQRRISSEIERASQAGDVAKITELKSEGDLLEKKLGQIRTQQDIIAKARKEARESKGQGIGSKTVDEFSVAITKKLKETAREEDVYEALGSIAAKAREEYLPGETYLMRQERLRASGSQLPTDSAQGIPPAQDFLLQVGSGGRVKFAQRVDANDVAVLSKPGGAIDRARGSAAIAGTAAVPGAGGVTNVFHLYNDAPGIVSAIAKAQRAGVL
jgi:hypothetical protein